MAAFKRNIGIDYSGAQTPTASLNGLRIYLAEGEASPVEVQPPPSPRKYWTRSLAAFLNPSLTAPERTTAQVEGWI